MIRGAIFDIDGTLLDSMFIWDTIGENYLRSIGYVPKENLNEIFKNMSLYQAACYYIDKYNVTLSIEEIMNGVNTMLESYYAYKVEMKPHAQDFLAKLHKKGVKMCIATATDKPLVEATLKRCGVLNYFNDIFTCTDVGHGKDEPFIYRKAMQSIGTTKAETIIFEDALYAVKTAKRDCFTVAAVYDKHEKGQSEIYRLADLCINDFSDFESFWKFASSI